LRHVSRKVVHSLVIAALLYKPIVLFVVFFGQRQYVRFYGVISNVWVGRNYAIFGHDIQIAELYLMTDMICILTNIAAVIASILTIIQLLKSYFKPLSTESQRKGVRGSVKILISQTGSMITLVSMWTMMTMNNDSMSTDKVEIKVLVFCFSVVIPVICSTLNPLIYLIFTPECRMIITNGRVDCRILATGNGR
jgi:hypothetical protein